MPHSLLRSTTVATLTLSMALLQPATGFAQDSTADPMVKLLCEDATKPPCPEGVLLLDEAGTKALRKARRAAEAAAAAATDQAATDQAATDAAAAQAAADQAAADQAAADQAAADQAAADQAAADQAAAEAAAEAAQAAADQAAADAVAQAAADQAAADAAAMAADQAAAEAAAQAAADEAAAAEAAAAEPAPDATVDQTEPAMESPPETAPDAAPDSAPVMDPEANPDTTAEPPATPDEVLPELPSGEATIEDIAAEPLPTPVDALPPVDAPLPEAVAGAIAAATGDAEAAAGAAAAVTTTVTPEDVRTSDEDFATTVSGATVPGAPVPEATASAAAANPKPRLTDLEKFGLVVLGAVVVGAIINNNRVIANSGDRVVVQRSDGQYVVLKDDDTLLRQPGSTIQTQTFADGSTLTTMSRPDGSKIITIRDAEGRVLRRALQRPDGTQTVLIDDTAPVRQVNVSTLPRPRQTASVDANDRAALAAALADLDIAGPQRSFSLRQIRDIREVRELAPQIDLSAITFASGSAAVKPDQAAKLADLGRAMTGLIARNPAEVFLIEGHTDAVGKAAFNLALSDRRAESVAKVLTEYFGVPPENLVVQGYGEAYLKVRTLEAEQANRRVAVRRITDLMRVASN